MIRFLAHLTSESSDELFWSLAVLIVHLSICLYNFLNFDFLLSRTKVPRWATLHIGALLHFKKWLFISFFQFFSARTSHIKQIAAVHGDDKFSTYVMHKVAISPSASEITGLQTKNWVLYHYDRRVTTTSISVALDSLTSYFEKYDNVILVGHNIKVFDIPILLHALESCSLI